jgi:hypothetical protein
LALTTKGEYGVQIEITLAQTDNVTELRFVRTYGELAPILTSPHGWDRLRPEGPAADRRPGGTAAGGMNGIALFTTARPGNDCWIPHDGAARLPAGTPVSTQFAFPAETAPELTVR